MPSILIVEDEQIISEPISLVLRFHEYDVDTASDGNEALKLCEQKTYDLILLDIMMPICDGIEFLKQANLQNAAPDTKVIVLSNLALGEEIREALRLGAKKSLLKADVTPSSLLEFIAEELAEKTV